MNMDFGLYQQQSMKLVMTNELRQAITILQYSALDLEQYLHEQQLENPLIELAERDESEELVRESVNRDEPFYDRQIRTNAEGDEAEFDQIGDQQETLQDALLNQIRLLHVSEDIRKVISYIALSTDENGYLTQSDEELAAELNEDVSVVSSALELLQSLEPHGVGARSLQECLLIQLEMMETRDPLAERIVSHYFELLAAKQYKRIAKEEAIRTEEVQALADFIATLYPKPGAVFQQNTARYVVPDVHVIRVGDEFHVKMTDDNIPKMYMNRDYEKLLKYDNGAVEAYMKKKYEQFLWIQNSIEQRRQTIIKVTEAIVRHQYDFFLYGPERLNPLTLKAIAEETEVHESTVSRATTNKYVQTPRGLFELKYFFNSSVGDRQSGANASERVKIYVKKMIEQEEKQKPLSDQKIAELLKNAHAIDVSRRTVAKYREEMHIPSSSKRKRYS
ncbi:RNA polymerase factor sigma-54 [Salisediminibacterium halotolerans]|uniref:RNA polymerase sigma-54 factor n=1 Tax=Salisediminibacterium halotolerans TaxID=517425 RepID=A0A1H9WRY8_9BACI|nr:RNA polymerase factor sigma-54 [Salisediminibacterium haloalkalitolerans]SES36702.1 RNA polymerase sigma-54 factor [Salisediminibacterium haloalkalitolerans]